MFAKNVSVSPKGTAAEPELVGAKPKEQSLLDKFGGLPKFTEFIHRLIVSMGQSQLKYGNLAL
jgi:hypothetical protein